MFNNTNLPQPDIFIPLQDKGITDDFIPGGLQTRGNEIGFNVSLKSLYEKAKKKARGANPIMANTADYVNWVFYDRTNFGVSTATGPLFQFFTQPNGQGTAAVGSGAKTFADTNLSQVQQIDAPGWANVVGMGFYFSPLTTQADVNGVLEYSYSEFWVSNKQYTQGPIQCYPSAAGQAGTASNIITNGWPVTSNFFDLRMPAGIHLGTDTNGAAVVTDGLIGITILQGQSFHVDVKQPGGIYTTTANGTGFRMMCFLYSIYSRSVQ